MIRRPQLGLPKGDGTGDRRSLLIAIGLHVAAFIFISGAVALPVLEFLREEAIRTRAEERVTFVNPAPSRPPADSLLRPRRVPPAQATEAPVAAPPVNAPPVVAPPVTPPAEIPVGIAPPRKEVAIGDTVDRRTVGRGMLPGLSPGPVDPRLLRPGPVAEPNGPNIPERPLPTDSITHSWIQTYWDSLASQQANARDPMDWTFNRNGSKYGIDPKYIYFGKFKLPTMLLALLPINTLANPTIADRRRALESMRWEIQYQAMRAVNDEAFNDAIKELRARKEREHEAAAKKKADEKKDPGKADKQGGDR